MLSLRYPDDRADLVSLQPSRPKTQGAFFRDCWYARAMPAKTPNASRRIHCAMDIKSPAVGKVLRLSVESGAQVARGDEVMVIESMKVEIPVKAPANGRIAEFRVKPGDQIQRNFVLAVLES
jgi:biotin carboxyl carrier protein